MIKKTKYIFNLCILLCGLVTCAQEFDTKLQGKISSASEDVAAIHISNVSKDKGTIADERGYFSIRVSLNDTLVFSAVQFKRKEVIVTVEIIESNLLQVFLESLVTELDEVVLMPYNLTGKLRADTESLDLNKMISARTENLPNAEVKALTQTARKLFAATDLDCNCTGTKLDPLFNYFSRRTKMLKERANRDEEVQFHKMLRSFYEDEWYISTLKIPKSKIDNFIYYCELDTAFVSKVKTKNHMKLIELMKTKSEAFRELNELDD